MTVEELQVLITANTSDARTQIARINEQLGKVDSTAGKAKSGIANAFSNSGKIIAGVGVAVAGAVVGVGVLAVSLTEDLQQALNGVQAETGTTDTAMSGMKETMLAIYNNNFGENFEDIGDAMADVTKQTGLTGKALQAMTEDAFAISDTFGIEVADSVKGANQMMKLFGVSGDEAYNLIAQGAQNGLDANGDLIDTISEYSGTFAAQGFSAEEMFNMLSNGAKAGVKDTDLMADAIKEFGIRSKESGGTASQAFTDLGLDSERLTASFGKGGAEGKKAFEEVTTKLIGMKDPVKQNELGVALFGTQFEDMGIKGVTAMVDTRGEVDKTKDALGKINEVKYNTFGEAMEGIKRNLETGILIPIGEFVLPIMTKFSNWLVANMPAIRAKIAEAMDGAKVKFALVSDWVRDNLLPIFEKIKTFVDTNMPTIQSVIGVAMDAIKLAFELAKDAIQLVVDVLIVVGDWCLANQGTLENIAIVVGSIATAWALVNGALAIWNVVGAIGAGVTWLMAYGTTAFGLAMLSVSWPIVLVIAAIAAVIAIGVLLWKNWDVIKAKLIEWKDALVAKFTELKDKVVTKVTELKDGVVAKFNEIKQGITDKVIAIKNAVVNKFMEIKTSVTSKVTEIKTAVVNKFNEIKTSVTTTVTNIKTAVVNKFNEIKGGVTTAITNVKTTVVGKFNEIKTSVTTTVGNIKTSVVDKFNEIKGGASTAFNNVKTAVMTPINDLKSKVSGVVNAIKGFFSGMHISIPKIKMPHFSVSGKLSLAPPSVPKLNVNWYQNGGVFDKASMIGVGENGSEAVMPLEKNTGWITELANKVSNRMPVSGPSSSSGSDRPMTLIMQVGSSEIGRVVIDSINKLQRQSGTILLDL